MKYKNNLNIFWGNKTYSCNPNIIHGILFKDLPENHIFSIMKQKIGAHALVVPHQDHTINGYMVKSLKDVRSDLFFGNSDFIVTHLPKIALATLTADCLPIILYDPEHHLIALIHAGWKGLVNGIVENAILTLHEEYRTYITQLELICGPAAQICCYEVQKDFKQHLAANPLADNCFDQRHEKIFFSLGNYLKNLAQSMGILPSHIDFSAHVCTICSDNHYSYRKDNKTPFRNITLVSLK